MPRTMRIAVTVLALAASASAVAEPGDVHPVVFGDLGYLLGGSAKGAWLPAGEVAPKLAGGEIYRHYSLNAALGSGDGPAPKSHGEPCSDTMLVEMLTPEGDFVVSVSADWNALPRVPRTQGTNQKVYDEAVAAYLKENGVDPSAVNLTRVIRIDLDGDGTEEVLIAATHYREQVPVDAFAGDYSVVLLRKLHDGEVHTVAIAVEGYGKDAHNSAPTWYEIAAVLDLDGDGVMEIVVRSEYYEGDGAAVVEIRGLEAKAVLWAGCGA